MLAQFIPFFVLFLTAIALGTMLFFAAVVAPITFKVLSAEDAGKHTRAIFPAYYLVLAGLSGVAGANAFFIDSGIGFTLIVVAAGFVFAREVMMPRINALRDEAKSGSAVAAQRFGRLHKWSVWLNMVQIAILIVVFWTLAVRV